MAGLLWQAFNLVKETLNRLFGLPDLALGLMGVRPEKQMRMRIVILRDERGVPLAGNEEVTLAFEEAQRLFMRGANVRVVPDSWRVVTAPHAAPRAALDVRCRDGAWQDDLGEAGAFFRSLMARNTTATLTGYGAPVTVFVVRSISTDNGCSLGAMTDYVTVEAKVLKSARRLVAHEVAHACGLWHTRDRSNLMYPQGPGERLSGPQAAVLRNSRHVTYW